MGYRLMEKPRTVRPTKALIQEFYEGLDRLSYERALREWTLVLYERLVRDGQFRPITWASGYCKETGGTYRLNGQHTATMLSRMQTIPDDLYIVVERWECDTMHDVSVLYATFDSKLASRYHGTIVNAMASLVAGYSSVHKKTFGLVVSAVSKLKWGSKVDQHPSPERAELLLVEEPFTYWVDGILFPAETDATAAKFLVRVPVVMAMRESFGLDRDAATAFWMHVREEDEAKGAQSRQLAKALHDSKLRGSNQASDNDLMSGRKMQGLSLQAWNNWRKGKTVVLRYSPSSPLPVAV